MERCDLDRTLLYLTLNTLSPVYPPMRVTKQRRRDAVSVQAKTGIHKLACSQERRNLSAIFGRFFFQVPVFLYCNIFALAQLQGCWKRIL